MIFGILFLAILFTLGYFAIVGIKVTVERHQDSKSLDFLRDILKYATLFLALFFFSFGLSGLLTELLDPNQTTYSSKEDIARWLSFVVVGIPVLTGISLWITRDFKKDSSARYQPAWQLYLFAATTFSFITWFLFFTGSLNVIAGAVYNPKAIATGLVSFSIWIIHIRLFNSYRSLMANLHRFVGWFAAIAGLAISLINVLELLIKNSLEINSSEFLFQESVIVASLSIPTAIFYWQNFDSHANQLEIRAYRYLGGQVIPSFFATIAATFTLNAIITWATGGDVYWDEVPSTSAAVAILLGIIYFFRKLLSGYERDEITRVYQYLLSAAAMVGMAISIGALIAGLLDKTDQNDAIIFGASLLLTTLPTWWLHWRKCQFAMAIDFEVEHRAPIRRAYLYGLIGVPTIVALGSSVWVAYAFFKALLIGGLDKVELSTPLGVLVSTGLVALYHLRINQREQI